MKFTNKLSTKTVIISIAVILLLLAAVQDTKMIQSSFLANLFTNSAKAPTTSKFQNKTVIKSEESVVIDVVKNTLPSVVTIGISKTTTSKGSIEIDPFNPFNTFRRIPGKERTIEGNIGSGFIISEDGMIITNKHVVRDTDAEYTVLTNDNQEYGVENIYRDPLNDLAILKINATKLDPVELGNSSKLQLGQMAIAIGTPLGEFKNTVTTGIVSGIGRGITAGSPFEGFVEKLDGVIQTDAAISPGNSGGPLLNSSGQVIGVNTAIASEGQNIGFAIPVNIVSELIKTFKNNGSTFERSYIGVRYQMVDRKTALLNKAVEGAYIESVVKDSPADKAGIQKDDIITELDGEKLDGSDEQDLARKIINKSVGERITLTVWRDGKILRISVVLERFRQ